MNVKMSVTSESALSPSGELLAWDTDFWGVRVGKGNSPDLGDWARENTIGLMCLLIDGTDIEGAHRAEANGAKLMDVRVKYGVETVPTIAVHRPVAPGDIDKLAEIARTAFRGLTRFYADPCLPDERCDDLYETWFRNSVAGQAAETLMVGDGGGPAGFVTIHVDGDEASIGLIAVSDRVRRRRLGLNLTLAAIDWAWKHDIPRMTVVTQGRNIAAQRTFQNAGFRLESQDLWFHSWYPG